MINTYSAGGIILNEQGLILLLSEDGFWGFPKGRIEIGETAIQAAIREIEEETGETDLQLIRMLGNYDRHPVINGRKDKSELKHITLFLFKTKSSGKIINTHTKHSDIRWFSKDDSLAILSSDEDRAFLKINIDSI